MIYDLNIYIITKYLYLLTKNMNLVILNSSHWKESRTFLLYIKSFKEKQAFSSYKSRDEPTEPTMRNLHFCISVRTAQATPFIALVLLFMLYIIVYIIVSQLI